MQATTGQYCWAEVYTYDIWGNLYNISGLPSHGACTQGLLSVGVLNNNRLSGFAYDAAGNMTTYPGLGSYTYDAENRMVSAGGVTYTYDAEGQRVMKSNGTLYWHGLNGEVLMETDGSGSNPTEYIFFNGQRTARRTSAGVVYYFFSDHLGSSRLVTNSQGVVKEDSDFYPFGQERVVLDTLDNNYKFTGQEFDPEITQYYFLARHYAPGLARFFQPDNFLNDTHVYDPQTWNLYSYARNNPLKYVDPTGEKVYVGDLEGDDLKTFLERANATYGCESCVSVDDQGFLAVNTSGLSDAVRDATAFLTDAINSETYFANVQVSNNDANVAFGENELRRGSVMYNGRRVNADLIKLDFGDDKHISGDPAARSTFLNTVFAHEIRHGFPTVESDPRTGTGTVVDAVNRITDALGLPRRTSYETRSFGGFTLQTFSRQTVDNKGRAKEQLIQIRWRKENVGGGRR